MKTILLVGFMLMAAHSFGQIKSNREKLDDAAEKSIEEANKGASKNRRKRLQIM